MNKHLHFFYTTRPYSYISEIVRGLVFGYIILNTISGVKLFEVALLSLLMWVYFNWQSDWIQKDKGRLSPTPLQCYSPLLIVFLVSFYWGGIYAMFGVLLYVCSILMYSIKAIHKPFGIFGPFFRFFTIIGHFLMIYFFLGKPELSIDSIYIVLVLAIYKAISNLYGDIRDIRTDKYELPARFGFKASLVFVRFLFIAAITLSFFISDLSISMLSIITLIVSLLILEVIVNLYRNTPYLIGYIGHRFIVISISVHLIGIVWHFGFPIEILMSLIFVLFISQYAYIKTPGKEYKPLIKFL